MDDVLQGARDIVAEDISDNASIRKEIRNIFHDQGIVESKGKKRKIQYIDYIMTLKSL